MTETSVTSTKSNLASMLAFLNYEHIKSSGCVSIYISNSNQDMFQSEFSLFYLVR